MQNEKYTEKHFAALLELWFYILLEYIVRVLTNYWEKLRKSYFLIKKRQKKFIITKLGDPERKSTCLPKQVVIIKNSSRFYFQILLISNPVPKYGSIMYLFYSMKKP